MEQKKLDYFQELLEQRKAVLINNTDHTVFDMGNDKERFADPTDRAELETTRSFTLRIRDRERKLLYKVEKALKRIETGSFAVCDICGGEIEEARLKARPVTTKCIECKQEEERLEKIRKM